MDERRKLLIPDYQNFKIKVTKELLEGFAIPAHKMKPPTNDPMVDVYAHALIMFYRPLGCVVIREETD